MPALRAGRRRRRRGGRLIRPMPRLGFSVAVAVAVLDQVSKAIMMSLLPDPGSRWPIAQFFNLVHVRNKGVSFGMMPGVGPWILGGFALVVAAVLAVWLWRAETRPIAAALGLIIGGAVGNVIDRARLGAVFDFLDFHAFGYHWPAFNVADAAITLGVIGLLLCGFRDPRRPRAAQGGKRGFRQE